MMNIRRLKVCRTSALSCSHWEAWLLSKGFTIEFDLGWLRRVFSEREWAEYEAIGAEFAGFIPEAKFTLPHNAP